MKGGVDARPALALGGGVCNFTDVCGAVSGGAVAIGELVGDHVTENRELAKDTARDLAQPYRRDFVAKFGTTNCIELCGVDMSTKAGRAQFNSEGRKHTHCMQLVVYAVRRLAPLADAF